MQPEQGNLVIVLMETPSSSERGMVGDSSDTVAGCLDVNVRRFQEEIDCLIEQQAFWKAYDRKSESWAFFSTVNNEEVTLDKPQLICCIFCHSSRMFNIETKSKSSRKGILTYNKGQGTSGLKKHVVEHHLELAEEYLKVFLAAQSSTEAQQPSKKRQRYTPGSLVQYFGTGSSYSRDDQEQKDFLEDLVLLCAKGLMPLSVAENLWFRRLAMRLDPKIVFPSRRSFCEDVIPRMVDRCMQEYVYPFLRTCVSCTLTFDLWMSRGTQDTFVLVVNFLNETWEPKHITVGIFEADDTSGAALARQLDQILTRFGLRHKVICTVKDEGSNLATMTRALKNIINCDALGLSEPFQGSCFGHAMSKACQYATSDDKVCFPAHSRRCS